MPSDTTKATRLSDGRHPLTQSPLLPALPPNTQFHPSSQTSPTPTHMLYTHYPEGLKEFHLTFVSDSYHSGFKEAAALALNCLSSKLFGLDIPSPDPRGHITKERRENDEKSRQLGLRKKRSIRRISPMCLVAQRGGQYKETRKTDSGTKN